jgi:uncharacterized protein with PIN domain
MTSTNRFVPNRFAVLFAASADALIQDARDGDEEAVFVLSAIDEFWHDKEQRTRCLECGTAVIARPGGICASCVQYSETNTAVMAFCPNCAAQYDSAEAFRTATSRALVARGFADWRGEVGHA